MNETDKALVAIPWDELGIPKPANQPIPKSVVREAYRVLAMPFIKPIAEAQIAKALGVKHLVARMEDGTFKKISADEISGYQHIEVWQRDPDMNAITDILNRCLDKPKEQPQEVDAQVRHSFTWKRDEE